MIKKIRSFTLIELLVVIAIIALLISILLPSLSRARELSKRLVCQSNMKGIGTSCKIYANDNNERWPIPPFDRTLLTEDSMVTYNEDSFTYQGESFPGQVGMNRDKPSYSKDPNASTQVSVTRAFWMLVRAGNVTTKQFTCPSSGDTEDPTESHDLYYDFTHYGHVSYGYQVPFGPRDTQPREGMDNRQPVIADKGPFYLLMRPYQDWQTGRDGNEVTSADAPKHWKAHNSPNHGGQFNGEGQNVLFADGHATFARTPIVGIDHDNIYTLVENDWTDPLHFNLIHGELPNEKDPPPHPGQYAFGDDPEDYAATDSLIYP